MVNSCLSIFLENSVQTHFILPKQTSAKISVEESNQMEMKHYLCYSFEYLCYILISVLPIWMQSSKEEQGKIRKPSSEINAKK